MASFDPTKPPISLEDKLAASPPATSVTGTTKLLTSDLKTVEVRLTQPTPAERAAAGDTVQVIGALDGDGSYDAATLAAIALKQAEGWPDNAIYVNVSGSLPSVATKTPAERAAAGEVVQVLGYTTAEGGYDAATLALIAEKQNLGWPDYSIWVRVMGTSASGSVSASATIPAFSAFASFTAPTVTGIQASTATATVPQFSAVSTISAPTVSATRNATATVPQFAAFATFSAPSVSVTPAGATAASVTVPSFGAVATFAAPNVTAQGAATASVPLFSALATFAAATVTGQRAATAAVPSFSVTSTLTAPTVAATRVATASVPSFGATAAFAVPTVTGVQQAAAVTATVSVPSFTARATLTAPTVTAKRVATAAVPIFAATATFAAPSVTGVQQSAAPTQPVITATGGDTTVTIAKTSGGTGATSYDIKWGTAAGSRPNTISGVTLPYTHTGRTNGTTYYYSLVATNAQGSTESAEVSAAAVELVVLDQFNIESWTYSNASRSSDNGNAVLSLQAIGGATATAQKTFTGLSTGKLRFDFRYHTLGFQPVFNVVVNGVSTPVAATPTSYQVSPPVNCPSGTVTILFELYEFEVGDDVALIDNLRWSPT